MAWKMRWIHIQRDATPVMLPIEVCASCLAAAALGLLFTCTDFCRTDTLLQKRFDPRTIRVIEDGAIVDYVIVARFPHPQFVITNAPSGELPLSELATNSLGFDPISFSPAHEAAGMENDAMAAVVQAIQQADHLMVGLSIFVFAFSLLAQHAVDVETDLHYDIQP
jgi:hypothetical protein